MSGTAWARLKSNTNCSAFKLFSFFISSESSCGIWRYEHGTRVAEFTDLRANARCLLESQAMDIRRRMSELKSAELASKERFSALVTARLSDGDRESLYRGAADCLSFDPFDFSLVPKGWLVHGELTSSLLLGDVFCKVLGTPLLALTASRASLSTNRSESDADSEAAAAAASPVNLGASFFAMHALQNRIHEGDVADDFVSHIRKLLGCHANHTEPKCIGTPMTSCNKAEDSGLLTPRPRARSLSAIVSRPRPIISGMQSPYSPGLQTTPQVHQQSPQPLSTDKAAPSLSRLQEHPTQQDVLQFPVADRLKARGDGTEEYSGQFQIGEPDHDFWTLYGALLEEHIRIANIVERTIYLQRAGERHP